MTKLHNEEYRAILAAMDEGLLVLDHAGLVIELNGAARRLLNLSELPARASVDDVLVDEKLNEFAHKALRLRIPLQDYALLRGEPDMHLKLYARPLQRGEGQEMGMLLVVTDITRLRQLESVRRDFVANVSHELKTPITSIKGFVETLLDGALKNPADAERFLQIIARQADRLNNIFEDLLTLARLEQQDGEMQIDLHESDLAHVLACAAQDCEREAGEKGITVRLDCPRKIGLPMNARLFEQAIANLVSNGIKYSESGKEVLVSAEQNADEVIVRVADQGCGIAEHNLPRIWERFYRVDQARSRKLGGTGLGLAIVKHIVQLHGGYADVKSALGAGSEFSLHFPRRQQPAVAG